MPSKLGQNDVVPVVLFVFNRHDNLPDTLACLKANKIERLYVFSDGPRNSDDEAGIAKVRQLIRDIDWVAVEIIDSKSNKGLSQSIQDGLDHVFKKHDRAIVIEDDISLAPEFYEYAKKCLATYKDDKRIMGITGLRYPFNRRNVDKSVADVFLAPRFSSWGWATWRDRWEQISFDRHEVAKAIDSNPTFDASIAGVELPHTVDELLSGRLSGCWDVYVLINMLLNGTYFVWPRYNMVRNTGLLEGTHANGVVPPWDLQWEKNPHTTFNLPQNLGVDEAVVSDFVQFFSNISNKGSSMKHQIKTVLKKIKHKLAQTEGKPDPKEYSTTDAPMEVPCQKEAYYLALNKYMKEGDKVLDVGCGIGYGLNLLSIKAKEAHGVDVDSKAVEYTRQQIMGKNPRVKALQAYDGYHLPYKDNEFDVVTCVDVLEHVEDYDKFVDELLRVAKRAVLISTPNRRPEYTNPDGTPMNYWHLREWSHPELDAILRKHTAKLDWNFINGPWEGPFIVSTAPESETMTLTPALLIKGGE